MKYWPRIIRVSLLDDQSNYIGIGKLNIEYIVNGKKIKNDKKNDKVIMNPSRIKKWCGIRDRVEVAIKVHVGNDEYISRSEIKLLDRISFFDFKFNCEELKPL